MEMSEPTKPRQVQASGAQFLGHGRAGARSPAPTFQFLLGYSAAHMAIMYAQLHLSFSATKPPGFTHLLQKWQTQPPKCLPPDNPQSLYLSSNFLVEKSRLFWLPWSNKLIDSVGKGIVGVYVIDGQASFTNRKPHRKPPGNIE